MSNHSRMINFNIKSKYAVIFSIIAFIQFSNCSKIYSQPFVEQTGITLAGVSDGSVAWGDYDNDGDLDILLTGNSTSKIYRNNGNNSFSEQTSITLTGVFSSSVAWGDYDNDGYLDILLTGYYSYGNPISKIYRNNRNNTFTLQNSISLPPVRDGAVTWGDFDNDGDLDILLTGQSIMTSISKIYRNNGDNTFSEATSISLAAVWNSSVAWGDYDNDGNLDIIIIGENGSVPISKIYHNDGNCNFSESKSINLPGVSYGSAAWGDYDNDGYLDILLTGATNSNIVSKIYRNNGGNSFTEQTSIALPGIYRSSAAWGDYDNDGDLDILLNGCSSSQEFLYVSEIFRNEGNNTFAEQTNIILPKAEDGLINWADYDNDGDLDILLAGRIVGNKFTKIYRNDVVVKKSKLISPVGLTSFSTSNEVVLSWDPVTSNATPAKAITYNIKVGTTPGSDNILSAMSSLTGYRRIVAMGNGQTDTFFVLRNLKKGTYFWSVQAVDNNFEGGAFSEEQSFISDIENPASEIKFSEINLSSIKCLWVRGNGENCIVFAKEKGQGLASPINNTTYDANAIFGSGSQIGSSGWFCVYKGSNNNINVTGLKASTEYTFHIIEYSGVAGNEQYSPINSTTNNAVQTTKIFKEQTGIILAGVSSSSAAWGDYDNDGYLDILLTGQSSSGYVSKLYRNNRNNSFTEQTTIQLSGVYTSSVAWCDYDNDSDLDISLTGISTTGKSVSKIYRNNGNNTFSEQSDIKLTNFDDGSISWGDYDKDGDMDILITGRYTFSDKATKIYRNNGDNTFIEQTSISLPGISSGSAVWGDYDHDGYPDILLSGNTGSNQIAKIYRNNGNNSFTEQTGLAIINAEDGSAVWGDYDSDGNLDILVTGYKDSQYYTKIYRNNGNKTFSEQIQISLPGVSGSSVAWGDCDNDGDLDILLTGNTSSGIYISKIYRNNGDNTFSEIDEVKGISNGSVAMGDYDNDGDLDILITGRDNSGNYVSKIYSNESSNLNAVPEAPQGLSSSAVINELVLKWNRVKTDETSVEAITYNVRIGTTPGSSDILSPMSNPSGVRNIVYAGNTQSDTFLILKNLKQGTYYWSVQAIDNSFAGSAFSLEQSIIYNGECPASKIKFTEVQGTSMTCSWERGSGENCIVFVKEDGSGLAFPENNNSYMAGSALGSGTQIGSTGWHCVYNGPETHITITGLKTLKRYGFHIIEYSGGSGNEVYSKVDGPTAHEVQITKLFVEQTDIILPGVKNGSAAWGDYDNDNDLDILLTGDTGAGYVSKVYRNNGDNTFIDENKIELPAVYGGSAVWGDYDNDSSLDLLLVGYSGSGTVSSIYHNNEDNTFTKSSTISVDWGSCVAWGDYDNDGDLDILFTSSSGSGVYRNYGNNFFNRQVDISFIGLTGGSADWGDYDNDGDLDVVMTGWNNLSSQPVSKIYRNNGDNSFTEQTSITLINVSGGSVAWGDYDSDGFLDILLTGSPKYSGPISKIYHNNGNNTFSETAINLTGISGSAVWGDYDNDGDLDILLTGNTLTDYTSKIYRNDGENVFTQQTDIFLPDLSNNSVAWGDYDNDGDLDLLLSGLSKDGPISKVFRNDIVTRKTLPDAPEGLTSQYQKNEVRLKWNSVKNDLNESLTYNLRIGTKSSYDDIVPSMSGTIGKRRIVAMGNAQTDTSFILRNLKNGIYYWSVQAIDNSFSGGPFSTEQLLNIYNPISNLKFNNIGNTTLNCSWNTGGSNKCIVFVKENGSGVATPDNNTTYIANSAFGTGTQISSTGWFCVYNGTGSSVTVTGLKPATEYAFHVIEYSGTAGLEQYSTVFNPEDHSVQTTNPFAKQIDFMLAGGSRDSETWCDYDNDGDLDVLLTSLLDSKIYRNNGDNTFTEQNEISLIGVESSSVAWGDYDRDGNQDILLTGGSLDSSYVSRIYRNNGNNSFTLQKGISLPGISEGAVAWGDYDNDGDPDILLTGDTGSGYISKIYRNNGNNTFTEQTNIILAPVAYSSVAWGDYDNDGDLDILLSGMAGSNYNASKIYRNNGNNTFTELTGNILPGVNNSSVSWGDYDNDGDLDILLVGNSGTIFTSNIANIYKNIGDDKFEALTGSFLNGNSSGTASWGDYDSDGDLDILITGWGASKVYRNDGDDVFTDQIGVFPTSVFHGGAWGDYDNDGDLDIMLEKQIYRNELNKPNTPPSGPDGLSAQYNGTEVHFSWNKPLDDKTNSNALSYDLYLYETTQNVYIKSSDAFPVSHLLNGRRRVARIGNIQYSPGGYILKGLTPGSYKWSIQAVDAGLAGSLFSNEATLNIVDLSGVGINVATSQITGTSSEMEYSISSSDGENGTWLACSNGNTSVNYNTGGVEVWVRHAGNIVNSRKVAIVEAQALAPVYSIDYFAEKTTESIPATVEYSINPTMTDEIMGDGSKIPVIPATTIYLRTKATKTSVASAIQILTVPARPVAPSSPLQDDSVNTFDWTNNPSFTSVLAYEYSLNDGINWETCTEKPLQLGNTNLSSGILKVRVKATPNNFAGLELASEQDFLYAIDLSGVDINVAASQLLGTSPEMEYSLNSTDGMDGTWITCTNSETNVSYKKKEANLLKRQNVVSNTSVNFNTGGFDVWVRQTDNISNKRKVASVAAQAEAPSFTINFLTEQTNETIPVLVEYSTDISMLNTSIGDAKTINLTPGTTIYLRNKATITSVASVVQTLVVPDRPEAPKSPIVNDNANTFDWTNNPLFNNVSEYEYSLDEGINWESCVEKPINIGNISLLAGKLRIRVKATSVNFTGNDLASEADFDINTNTNNLSNQDINLYPNPVNDVLYLNNLPEKAQITITSLEGRLIKEFTNEGVRCEISVNHLSSGVYVVRIKINTNEFISKFIKN